MQRYGLPIALALVLGVVIIVVRSYSGGGDTDLPFDLEAVAITHSTDDGLTVQFVNNSENPFKGDLRLQIVQGRTSVTTTVSVEMIGFGVAEGEVDGDWLAGDGTSTFALQLDPLNDLDDTNVENNSITFTCPLPDAACKIDR